MDAQPEKKPLVFLTGINAPPLTPEGRRDAGYLLNRVQDGEMLSLPISRPMGTIGQGVHELRLSDESGDWRVVYRIDADLIIVVEVFKKATQATPKAVIDLCKRRLAAFDTL